MSSFGETTTAKEVATAFKDSIRGKNIVITGVRPGSLGLATINALAPYAKTIIIASRTVSRVEEAIVETRKIEPNVDIRVLPIDLLSLASIRETAAKILAFDLPIHVLINNAGILPVKELAWTVDGFEAQIAGDHFGHFLLTSMLFPAILRSKSADWSPRIINLSSNAAFFNGEPRLEDINFKKHPEEYHIYSVYSKCKAANAFFSIGLADKFGKDGVLSYAVHPGCILETTMAASVPMDDLKAFGVFDAEGKPTLFIKNFDQGAATTVFGAFSPSIVSRNGAFLLDAAIYDEAPEYLYSHDYAEKLWQVTEENLGIKFGQAV